MFWVKHVFGHFRTDGCKKIACRPNFLIFGKYSSRRSDCTKLGVNRIFIDEDMAKRVQNVDPCLENFLSNFLGKNVLNMVGCAQVVTFDVKSNGRPYRVIGNIVDGQRGRCSSNCSVDHR